MQKRIEDLTEIELKAHAYDTLAAIQFHQNTLNGINQELQRRAQTQGQQPQVPIPSVQTPIPRVGEARIV